jgi:hypothetical protein
MTISVIQAVAKNTLSSTITATGGSNDRALIVCVNSYNATLQGTISSVKLGTATLTQAVTLTNTSDGFESSWIFYKLGIASGQTSVVVTGSNLSVVSSDGGIDVMEVSGLALSSALDKAVSAQGTSTTYSVASGTLGQANELIVGTTDGVSLGAASGWTTIGTPSGRSTGYKIVSAATAQTFTGTAGSGGWVSTLASFKAPSTAKIGGFLPFLL